jgi:hypothetical protein
MFALILLLTLYGAGMIGVLFFASEVAGLKMLTGFASMFTGILGLGSGYLLGRSQNSDRS